MCPRFAIRARIICDCESCKVLLYLAEVCIKLVSDFPHYRLKQNVMNFVECLHLIGVVRDNENLYKMTLLSFSFLFSQHLHLLMICAIAAGVSLF